MHLVAIKVNDTVYDRSPENVDVRRLAARPGAFLHIRNSTNWSTEQNFLERRLFRSRLDTT
jgi:hypothetical protein